MGKRIISVLLIVGICLSVTACSPLENLFTYFSTQNVAFVRFLL